MFDSQVEEIKNRLDVVEVVGSYLKLTKTGANYRGICPFHSEKKPSFFVSPARQMWHCFGCSAGSSIFDFVMKIEGVEFGDALRILAQKAGIELKKQDPKLTTARQRLYEICEFACRFFEKQLGASSVGKEAKDYLLGRAIKEESIKKWRVGYSPDTWQGLSDFLVGKGYKREEIIRAGLAVESEKGKNPYDRFRGRIIFPVFDLNSQVVGFGARIFKVQAGQDETAKYINTPQTLLYDKGRLLYGLNYAKVAIRKKNQCILTEGYTDVLMSHQEGFENTVAAAGTALTPHQLTILKRYSENLLLSFDMDIAGDTATKRGIDLAQEKGFDIKVIRTQPDSDPADIISKDPNDWEKAIAGSRSILDFYFESAFSSFDKNTPQGKKEIGKIVLPIIKRIPNKIEQSFWIQKLAQQLGVRQEDVFEELKKIKINPTFLETAEPSQEIFKDNVSEKGSREQMLEEKIVSLIIKDPESLNFINEAHFALFSEKTKSLLDNFKKIHFRAQLGNKVLPSEARHGSYISDITSLQNSSGQINPVRGQRGVVEAQTPLEVPKSNWNHKENKPLTGQREQTSNGVNDDSKNFLAALALRSEVGYEEDAEEEIQLCLGQLKTISVKQKLKGISEELKRAEAAKDTEKINNLITEFNKITKEL